MMRLASTIWAVIWPMAPPTLTPRMENIPLGIHHMMRPAVIPPPSEKKKVGVKMLPVSAEAITTLEITTKSAQGPPKVYSVQIVMMFARPNLRNGAGLGINDSVQCRATAMAINRAILVIRRFFSMLYPELGNL